MYPKHNVMKDLDDRTGTGSPSGVDSDKEDPANNAESAVEDCIEEYANEFNSLNKFMDEIDNKLNSMENQTDDLVSQLKQLLSDNQQIRQEIKDLNQDTKGQPQ